MNLFKARALALKEEAYELWGLLPDCDRLCIGRILEDVIVDRPFLPKDVMDLQHIISECPIILYDERKPLTDRQLDNYFERRRDDEYYVPPWHSKLTWRNIGLYNATADRLAAESLLRYIGFFKKYPRLRKDNPIGLCDQCESLFWKNRPQQKCCSPRCYALKWSAKKLLEDPRYFADKAAESRRARRAPGVSKRL